MSVDPIFTAPARYMGRWVLVGEGTVAHRVSLDDNGRTVCGLSLWLTTSAVADADEWTDGCQRCVKVSVLREVVKR